MSAVQSSSKKNPLMINELLTKILDNLKIQPLISLRLICCNWKSVIESICKLKRNLRLTCVPNGNDRIRNRFFGEIKLNTFTELKLKLQTFEPDLCTFLRQLFPSIDQLIVNVAITSTSVNNLHEMVKQYWPNVTTFSLDGFPENIPLYCDQISQMKSFKRLDLVGFLNELPNEELFAKLEHLSCLNSYRNSLHKTMPQLGPNCTSFWFGCESTDIPSFNQWIARNSSTVLANLTHLGLSTIQAMDGSIIGLISGHFHSLQVLSVKFRYMVMFDSDICAKLVKLTHLKRLTLGSIRFDIFDLEKKNPLTQLASIRVLHLIQFGINLGPVFSNGLAFLDGARFCRILSSIVPNLEELGTYYYPALCNSVHNKIENNLSQFDKVVQYKRLSKDFDF